MSGKGPGEEMDVKHVISTPRDRNVALRSLAASRDGSPVSDIQNGGDRKPLDSPVPGGDPLIESLRQMGVQLGLHGPNLADFVMRERATQLQHDLEVRRLQVREKELDASVPQPRHSSVSEFAPVKIQLPFYDDKEDLEAYLAQFERIARIQKWHPDTWAVRLGTVLRGKAREVYVRMDEEQATSFEAVAAALLANFKLTSETYRKKLRTTWKNNG
jgi:hypothetical protein